MGGLKEIRRRITSVKNTKQITRAMKLVSAAKLRRAQDAAVNGRAYSDRLVGVIQTLLGELPENFSHPLLTERKEIKRRLTIVVAGERGLCGAYNTNVMKGAVAEPHFGTDRNHVLGIGARVVSAIKRLGWVGAGSYEKLPENAALWPIEDIANIAIQGFTAGEYDEVTLIYTRFSSAISQVVTKERLLPLSRESLLALGSGGVKTGAVKTSPGPEALVSGLIPLIVAARIRQAGLESKASEHASRMTAMDSATKNAEDLIDKLRLYYNRARQSAITTELIDIVGGAEAVK